jgi:hypothetical protein
MMRLMVDLREILSAKKPKPGNTLVAAIDGHGGSGKTTAATFLAENRPSPSPAVRGAAAILRSLAEEPAPDLPQLREEPLVDRSEEIA